MASPKKVIVVGASSGMGRELAILYCKLGCKVGITGRRKTLLEELQQQFPSDIIIQSFDNVSDDVEQNLTGLISKLGGLDLFILSSGAGYINRALDFQIEKNTIDLNVLSWTRIIDFTFNYFMQQAH